MAEYTGLSVVALLVAGAAAIRVGLHRQPAAWLTLGVFLAATVVFDGLLVANGIVRYAAWARSGLSVGAAPIEDLAFGSALCLTAMSAWRLTAPAVPTGPGPR